MLFSCFQSVWDGLLDALRARYPCLRALSGVASVCKGYCCSLSYSHNTVHVTVDRLLYAIQSSYDLASGKSDEVNRDRHQAVSS